MNYFGSYDKTYGSFSGIVIRVGGELNTELEHTSAGGKAPGEKKELEIESNQDMSHPAANVKKAISNDLDKQLTRR